MPANPPVSIAMCSYNAERFIAEQLESFLAQTVLPAELVLQDDASTDGTLRVVEAFAARAPFPVRLEVNSARLGPTGNFERAMTRCQGEVVVFSDADDAWLPERIAAALEVLASRPEVGLVFSDAMLADEHLAPRGVTLWQSIGFSEADQRRLLEGQLTDAFFRRTIGFGGSMTIRKAVLEAALPIARPWGHDNWTAVVGAALFEVAILPRPLMLYRQHAHQYSGGSTASFRERVKASGQPKAAKDWVPRASSYHELERRLLEVKGRATDPARLGRAVQAAREKAAHQAMRESLSRHLLLRLAPVLLDAARSRYSRYSNGALSALRDLAFGRY